MAAYRYGSFATEAIQQQVRACLLMIRKRKEIHGVGDDVAVGHCDLMALTET